MVSPGVVERGQRESLPARLLEDGGQPRNALVPPVPEQLGVQGTYAHAAAGDPLAHTRHELARVGAGLVQRGAMVVRAAVGASSGGEQAVMALTTDAPVRPEAIERILALEGFSTGRSVDL